MCRIRKVNLKATSRRISGETGRRFVDGVSYLLSKYHRGTYGARDSNFRISTTTATTPLSMIFTQSTRDEYGALLSLFHLVLTHFTQLSQ